MSVFISYRRADSQDVCGRIYDHLTSRYGERRVFKDVDSIPLARDFRTTIEHHLSTAKVVLVVIGPTWLDRQNRRLHDADDYVRIEIERALANGIPILPILVRGAQMPAEAELPDVLKPIVFLNAAQVRPDPDFKNDLTKLCKGIDSQVGIAVPAQSQRIAVRASLIAIPLVVVLWYAVNYAVKFALSENPTPVHLQAGGVESAARIVPRAKKTLDEQFSDAENLARAVQYSKGDGVEMNRSLARQHAEAAIRQGNADAAYLIAKWYENGDVYVKNSTSARSFLERSAQMGHSKAAYELAKKSHETILSIRGRNGNVMHMAHYGLQDPLHWYIQAHRAGHENALREIRAYKWSDVTLDMLKKDFPTSYDYVQNHLKDDISTYKAVGGYAPIVERQVE